MFTLGYALAQRLGLSILQYKKPVRNQAGTKGSLGPVSSARWSHSALALRALAN
jgi:hypothetical protein